MGTQYLRQFKCILADKAGNGLDFSALRCTFTIRRGDIQTPNTCDVRIYNITPQTAVKAQKEFSQIQLQAGYEGTGLGLIFEGTVKQWRFGRIDQKDSYMDVTAADGDEAYNYSHAVYSLIAANNRPSVVLNYLAAQMGLQIANPGVLSTIPNNALPRGCAIFGRPRDHLRQLCIDTGLTWSIQDGKLTFIPLTAFVPGPVPVISPSTGLVGVPEQMQDGISIKILLNPQIKIGQLVKLDSTVNLLRYGADIQSNVKNALTAKGTTPNADGYYYVMVAEHEGDTRGNPWYTKLICLSTDASVIPPSLLEQKTVLPASASENTTDAGGNVTEAGTYILNSVLRDRAPAPSTSDETTVVP